MKIFSTSVFLLSSALDCSALSSEEWRRQSIYQILTDRFGRTDNSITASCNVNQYCGGTWQGIINHLDYIQNMGFTAIWISPVVKNVQAVTSDGDSYHGYWAQKIYSVNPNFGSPGDLQALSAALHSRGMYLMVDVVTNHMGYDGCGNCVDYSIYDAFNDQRFFHPFCLISNYQNATNAELCWEGDNTFSLPDLRTEDLGVRNIWNSWITSLVSNYSIDGLRIDSCLEVEQSFYPGFVQAAGTYAVCEAFNGDPKVVCPYQSYVPGLLNYPAYFWITHAFQSTSGSISNLYNGLNTMLSDCLDTSLLGSFTENHDNPRFPSKTSDMSLAKNAIAFSMLADGIPIIYQGQEQHFAGGNVPNNREAVWSSGYSKASPLYSHITTLNKIRAWAINKDSGYLTARQTPFYQDTHTIAVRKGTTGSQIVGVFNNFGTSSSAPTLSLSGTGYTVGTQLIELLSCNSLTVDSNGKVTVPRSGGAPVILYPASLLVGSGLCTNTIPSNPGTTSTVNRSPTLSTGTPSTLTRSTCVVSPTAVAVTFNEVVVTAFGETVKLAGSTPQLGSWNAANAVQLSPAQYTASNPLWSVTVSLPPGLALYYKFLVVQADGTVRWESDPNRAYTVPKSCATSAMVQDTWR